MAIEEPVPTLELHPNANPKHAYGLTKPPLDLIPPVALVYEAMVFKHGSDKYGSFNWRDAAVVRSVYLAAAMRHLLALMDGQDKDPDSGCPHESHVRACMGIVQDARECGKLIDDRHTPGQVSRVMAELTVPRKPDALET